MTTEEQGLSEAVVVLEQRREVLPGGLNLRLRLDRDVRSGQVGSTIGATLVKSVRTGKSVTISEGAHASGHIRMWQPVEGEPNSTLVGIEFNEMQWANGTGVFVGDVKFLQPMAGVEVMLYRQMPSSASSLGELVRGEQTHPVTLPGVASFFLRGVTRLPAGFELTLETRMVPGT